MIEFYLEFVPHTDFSWIPALIGAASALGSTLIANQSNKDNAIDAYNRQKDYNNWLLHNQTQARVADLRKSGLNPAFMNGSQLGSTPSPPTLSMPENKSPFDLSSAMLFGQTIANTQNLQANTRKTLADARAQELLNADKEATNKELGKRQDVSYTDWDGVPIDNLDEWIKNHPMQVPNQIVLTTFGKDGAQGKFEAQKALKRWDKEANDIDVGMLHNQLQSMVTNGQISSPRVVQALQNMPYWTYKEIVNKVSNLVVSRGNMLKQGELLDIQKVTAQLEQDMAKDNNIYQYIEKMFDGDFEIKDLAKVLVMAFLGCVTNFGGVSSGVKSLRSSPAPVHNTYINTQQ